MKLKINLPNSSFDTIRETMLRIAKIETELKKEHPELIINIEVDFITGRMLNC